MRRVSTCLAVLGLAVLGLSATASAAPKITLKAEAVQIPGWPHTGNILGAGAALQTELTISGTEYDGYPPPLIGVDFYGPAGAKVHPQGFTACAPSVIEAEGTSACPKASMAGPKGTATGVVTFGKERVKETATVQPFFAPGGGLEFFAHGTEPVSIEIVSKGRVSPSSSPPFGPEVVAEVPLIESVTGALDASEESISVKVGAAYKKGRKTTYYITVPKKCPKGGFPVKAVLTFGKVSNPKEPGETAEALSKTPCPKK